MATKPNMASYFAAQTEAAKQSFVLAAPISPAMPTTTEARECTDPGQVVQRREDNNNSPIADTPETKNPREEENKKRRNKEQEKPRIQETKNSTIKERKNPRKKETKNSRNAEDTARMSAPKRAVNLTIRDEYMIAINVLAAQRRVRPWVVLDEAIRLYLDSQQK